MNDLVIGYQHVNRSGYDRMVCAGVSAYDAFDGDIVAFVGLDEVRAEIVALQHTPPEKRGILNLVEHATTIIGISRPERQKAKLKSAKRRHREAAAEVIGKQPQLGDELARFFFDRKKPTEIDEAAITEAIRALGHKVKKITRRSVPVVFRGRKKPRRYNFADLVDGVVVELERLNGTRAGSGSESGDFAANMETEITPIVTQVQLG